MQDYADKFTSLVDQLIAYGKNTDPIYCAMKFVMSYGMIFVVLFICSVLLHSSAVVLALLQEEMVDPSRRKESWRPESYT